MAKPRLTSTELFALPLEELLPHVYFWHVGPEHSNDKDTLTLTPDTDFGRLDQYYTVQDFCRIDPRFEQLIPHLAQRCDHKAIDGSFIKLALEDWREDNLKLPTRFVRHHYNEGNVPPEFSVSHINDIGFDRDGSIVLLAQCRIPTYLPDGSSYAADEVQDRVVIALPWLQQHAPDWRQRWAAAEALQLDHSQWPQYIFGAAEPVLHQTGTSLPSNIDLGLVGHE